MTISTVDLEFVRIAARQFISARQLLNTSIEIENDAVLDGLAYQMQRHLATQPLEEIVVSYPATWWDAFKLRFFPDWAQRRWPVNLKARTIDVKVYYPEIALPDQPHTLRVNDSGWIQKRMMGK